MAIDTNSLVYLIDPFWQGENTNGKPLVGGYMTVFYAGTDIKYITYQNFDGTQHPFKIPLNSDGRATILVEPNHTYDCYLYDSFGNLVCSRLNIKPVVGGDISISGGIYTGIEPIVVNNDVNLISANHVPLGVQDPLYFVQDDEEGCILGFSGGIVDPTEFIPWSASGVFLTALPSDVAYTGWVENSIVSATSGLQISGDYLSLNDLNYGVINGL